MGEGEVGSYRQWLKFCPHLYSGTPLNSMELLRSNQRHNLSQYFKRGFQLPCGKILKSFGQTNNENKSNSFFTDPIRTQGLFQY